MTNDMLDGFDVNRILLSLKDFQRQTVDYVFRRLYLDENRTRRFLIADEVGLGKTLVARGLIAKAVEHLASDVKRIDVVYICSNGDIARQNINRLNIFENNGFVLSSRITLLPLRVRELDRNRVNLLSLTPGTSFDLKSTLGIMEERALLYNMLRQQWELDGSAALHFFRGYAGLERFTSCARNILSWHPVDESLASAYLAQVRQHDEGLRIDRKAGLVERTQMWFAQFDKEGQPEELPDTLRSQQAAIIGELRTILAQVCIHAIEPDIVILDEFQRFRTLLENNDPMSALAHHLFDYRNGEEEGARVILLSATPYKMYTMAHEADEDHYSDFLKTLEFLMNDPAQVAEVGHLLKEYRHELLRGAVDLGTLYALKTAIEDRLSQVMVRTERLSVTPDRDGMLVSKPTPGLELCSVDLESYVAHARLADELNEYDVIDYWKSAPYLLNFMDGYKLTRTLHSRMKGPELGDLPEVIRGLKRFMFSQTDIEAYAAVDPQNARLRSLLSDVADTGLWKLLWLPPALPYYRLSGAFADAACHSVTKRLVFSSWKVVPRVLAALLSYEAERCMITAGEADARNTPEDRKRRSPLLHPRRSEGRPASMSLMNLVYPSIMLAECESLDPLFYLYSSQKQDKRPYSLETVLAQVAAMIERLFMSDLKRYQTDTTGPIDESWYWAAPILLDLHRKPEAAADWLNRSDLASIWLKGVDTDESSDGEDSAETISVWQDHVTEARKLMVGGYRLGPMPPDLVRVLALTAVGSPAVAALRALTRVFGRGRDCILPEARLAAGAVAHGFLSLFNLPETIALVRSRSAVPGNYADERTPYWQIVLRYNAAGCLQAVLDEYAHILNESLGLIGGQPGEAAHQIGDAMREALQIRTVSLQAEELRYDANDERIAAETFRLRSRFAMRFGDDRGESEQQQVRAEHVRTAFNSPFWPYVLATTSVGQEGLDFHQYCHAVVHWNLPSNPVDLEQREGRVHRYKGHAVRKNLSATYSDVLRKVGANCDCWEAMFKAARDTSGTDIDPFWVLAGNAKVERYVLALPFSRDESRFLELQKALVVYRMAFGQNRQEDLAKWLMELGGSAEGVDLAAKLRINLEPPSVSNCRTQQPIPPMGNSDSIPK